MTWVGLSGRLDVTGTHEIDMPFTALIATKKAAILVDLSRVDFIASIGMRTLLSYTKALSKRGGKMLLVNAQPMVKEVLVTAGIDQLIPIYDGEDAARAALKDIELD